LKSSGRTISNSNGAIMKSSSRIIIWFCLIISLSFSAAFGQDVVYRWISIAGKWETRKDNKEIFLIESKSKTYNHGYSELINYNSLISQDVIIEPSLIQFSFSMSSPANTTEQLFFFNSDDFRSFYAFKLAGDGKKISKISLISSKINDTTLPRAIKNNFTVSEMAAKECSLDYNKDFASEIAINKRKKTLAFKVNGKELLSTNLPNDISSGKIGFSNRNAVLKIAGLKVYSGKKVVFEDDFSTDSIKRLKFTAKKISETEDVKKK
jgi:hypothetical protein